jgi:hypothetical protein
VAELVVYPILVAWTHTGSGKQPLALMAELSMAMADSGLVGLVSPLPSRRVALPCKIRSALSSIPCLASAGNRRMIDVSPAPDQFGTFYTTVMTTFPLACPCPR